MEEKEERIFIAKLNSGTNYSRKTSIHGCEECGAIYASMWRLSYQSNKHEWFKYYCDKHKPSEQLTKSYQYNIHQYDQNPRFICSVLECTKKHSFKKIYQNLVEKCEDEEELTVDDEIKNYEGKIETLKLLKLNKKQFAKIENLANEAAMELAKSVYEISVRQEQIDRLFEEIDSIEDVKTEQMEGLEQIMKRMSSVDAKSKELEKKLKSRYKKTPESDSLSCGVCFEKYDKESRHQACITACFHTFCFRCLTTVDPKICPKCREPFEEEHVKKIY